MEEVSPSKSQAQADPTMAFLNVARTYVPNTKVECHYTLPPSMKPSARDWIGIFKVEASSVRDYYTFVWCVVPDGGAEGAPVHSSVQFHASYLPKPGAQQYQFRYVDRRGEVRGQSSPFQFNEPRPMDELITLEEDDEGNMDMLLVVPKATLLQNQLEESQQEHCRLLREKLRLEEEVKELQARIEQLEEALGTMRDEHTKLAEQYKDLSSSHAAVMEERDALSQQQAGQLARIQELEEDIQALSEKVLQKEVELDRMKDTVKSLVREQEQIHHQLKEENAEKEHYQVKLQASEQESRNLACDLLLAKTRHGEKVSQALVLQEDISKLQQKLAAAQQRTAQLEALCEQLRSTQDLLAASQQKVVLLGEELASTSSIRDRTISDLHKSRLESAETNIKLADMTLKWKEGKGQWWKEKSNLLQSIEAEKDKILKLSAEVLKLEKNLQEERAQKQALKSELSHERDSSLVQLSESKRELKELRAALKVAEKEKEQLQEEKQELLEYARKLEERLEKVADEKWSELTAAEEQETAATALSSLDSPLSDSEDESPEDMRIHTQLSSYSLCDNRAATKTPPCLREPMHRVVISQPAPITTQIKQATEDNSSDSEAEDEKAVLMAAVRSGGEEASLLLPELGSIFYEMASGITDRQPSDPDPDPMGASPLDLPASPGLWKECPVCKERFPLECDKEALEEHVDSHFFFSAHDPFAFE
ncbi:calcium-binding and coiled-coil domain-containing protein 1 isoform X2 [Dermochelys coriacea]|nr:calcium-binding and coiled-coil domain-containing protein 1 isoform X2 [Dermochelys coriacea]XP_043362665.1 calcium-binding and coiled-coil domain-containing protein 1 isoform X2 [Dermochelys coriacea]XP_043362666.1 calcium-binding and coiled-coil domain-containing protein 1 isoform X2 [Dermochelys coriacea]XP_043362667.1 calcium-binding and coiled-coil domain-containing protein 1 isoform X2 [Dermochelys coriacea]